MLQPAATLTIAENSRREERRLGRAAASCAGSRVATGETPEYRSRPFRRVPQWLRGSAPAEVGGIDDLVPKKFLEGAIRGGSHVSHPEAEASPQAATGRIVSNLVACSSR